MPTPSLPIVSLGLGLSLSLNAQTQELDLLTLDIEQLSQIQIQSVSKREQQLSKAAASIYVITASQIRQSGASSLPEVLRLAPNLNVSRGDAGQYAISARGFNNALGNKLLVLIDGRTVYSPFFSGVFWISQDLLLEDIERIEVLSGAGGSLWGTNAVNGVINIRTRTADKTEGQLISSQVSRTDQSLSGRTGGRLGAQGAYRLYAKKTRVENTETSQGLSIPDGFDRNQAGFRLDWDQGARQYQLQGDSYYGESEQNAPERVSLSGSNLLGRYRYAFDDGAQLQLQSYFDRAVRDSPGVYSNEMQTLDLELQHQLTPWQSQQFMWGAGYRTARDQTRNLNPLVVFLPEFRSLRWWNLFVQDEIQLQPDWTLTLASKWENNRYTGTEFLPSLRLAWSLDDDSLLWTSLARTVRAPSRLDRDFYLLLPGNFGIHGGPNFESEVSRVAELGYRTQASRQLSYSMTLFYDLQDKQRSGEPNPEGPGYVVSNSIEGQGRGLETWLNYQPTTNWQLELGFNYLDRNLHNRPDSQDPQGPRALGNDPRQSWLLKSSYQLTEQQQIFMMLRHIGRLPDPAVSAYSALDVNYQWQLSPDFRLATGIRNLLDAAHTEFGNPTTASEYPRTAWLQLTWSH